MTRNVLSQHQAVIAVLVGFFVLGGVYSMVTPLFEAPDEIQHYFHVKHIADGKGLPVLKPEGEALYGQEGGQPSLYYLLGALATFWIDTDDAETLLEYNPYVNLGVPTRDGNKNVILHTSREAFPYQGTALAVHLLRGLSLLFGGLTILATYLMVLQIFSGRGSVALGAAVVTAFNPQFVFTNASVNNDGLLIALCSLAMLISVVVVIKGPSLPRFAALGAAGGLAALTKLTGLGLLVPVLVVVLVVAVRHSPRVAAGGAVIVIGLLVAVAGWWYARNWLLYQDLTGMSRFFEALGATPGRELTLHQFIGELEGFRLSYWALFGWFNVLAGRWVYRFFDLLLFLGLIGLPLAVTRGLKRRNDVSFAPVLVALVWVATVGAGYVRYNQLIDAATGRLVFPAISCVSTMLAWGLVQFPPSRHRLPFVWGLGVAMFAVALACPFLYVRPAYARPPMVPPERWGSIPNQMEVSYGERLRLVGYELEQKVFHPGQSVYATLYWQGLSRMDSDYSVSLVLLTPSGQVVGQEDSYPGLGSYPTSQWGAGEIIADRCWVRIKPRAQVPTAARLGVSVYYLPTMERLPASRDGEAVGQVLLDQVKVVPWGVEDYASSSPVHRNLGHQIDLMAYDLEKRETRPGSPLELILYWRARAGPDQDYTVFTHLVDSEGRIWAQDDSYPLRGDYPTSFWEAGEVIRDRYELVVPGDIPPGVYQLEVGLYLAPSLERLPVLDDDGRVLDNRIVLPTITVVE